MEDLKLSLRNENTLDVVIYKENNLYIFNVFLAV